MIIIHHTATSVKQKPQQSAFVNDLHKAKWNFKSSLGFYGGYHYLIEKNGRVEQFRADNEPGAHTYGYNDNIGIALAGHFNLEQPSPAQIFALRDLLKKLVKKYGVNKNDIRPHSDFSNTACPGNNLDITFVRSLVSPNVPKPSETDILKDKIIKYIKSL